MTLLDHFAENLARHDLRRRDRGGDVEAAARRLGQSKSWGAATLRKICAELGDQAR